VVFNQVLVSCPEEELTKTCLANLQAGGVCWCGNSLWQGETAIRVSVCSWATTKEDVRESVRAFVRARKEA